MIFKQTLIGLAMASTLHGVVYANESRFGVLEDQQHVITTVPRPVMSISPIAVVALPVAQPQSEMIIEQIDAISAVSTPTALKRKRHIFKPHKPKVICAKDAS